MEALGKRRQAVARSALLVASGSGWCDTGLIFTTAHGIALSPRNDYRSFRAIGHSQISVTLNLYSHVAPEVADDAAERIQGALWADPDEDDDPPTAARVHRRRR